MLIEDLDDATRKVAASFSERNPECDRAVGQAFEQLGAAMQASHVNSTHRRQIAAVAFASRLLQVCHGAFEAIRSGNLITAQILVRSALEALFALGGLSNQRNFESGQDFYLRLLYKSKHSKQQALNRFLKNTTTLSPEDRVKGESKVNALAQDLINIGQTPLTQVRDVSDAAGMLDMYARDYALHSSPTHADMEDVINTHVDIDDDKVILKGLNVGNGNAKEACAHLVLVLMEGTVALERLFEITHAADHLAARESLSQFYGNALRASI